MSMDGRTNAQWNEKEVRTVSFVEGSQKPQRPTTDLSKLEGKQSNSSIFPIRPTVGDILDLQKNGSLFTRIDSKNRRKTQTNERRRRRRRRCYAIQLVHVFFAAERRAVAGAGWGDRPKEEPRSSLAQLRRCDDGDTPSFDWTKALVRRRRKTSEQGFFFILKSPSPPHRLDYMRETKTIPKMKLRQLNSEIYSIENWKRMLNARDDPKT